MPRTERPQRPITKHQVGDRMILLKEYGALPIDTKIIRTTKCTIQVEGYQGQLKATYHGDIYEEQYGRYGHQYCYPWTQEMWDNLIQKHQKAEDNKKQREEERQRKGQERKEKMAKEFEEVKEACGGELPYLRTDLMDTLPDGSRLYILNLPVKPDYAQRKKGFQILFVRCSDTKEIWMDENHKVEAYMSYTTGNSSSFPSISPSYGQTDEECLWECCRYAYHSS